MKEETFIMPLNKDIKILLNQLIKSYKISE